jgi:hypothetical protein
MKYNTIDRIFIEENISNNYYQNIVYFYSFQNYVNIL